MTIGPNSGPVSGISVLVFGDRPVPRPLAGLTQTRIDAEGQIDGAIGRSRRLAVVGSEGDLAAVLTRLMRDGQLDIEVAHVRGRLDARRAVAAPARRIPLIRDDTGTVIVGSALWLPPEGATVIVGEAVADDAVLFDGEVAEVRIEPTAAMPGIRAAVAGRGLRRWQPARAVQLGTTGARVVRDGVTGARQVRRSTFYRHTTGWLRVG
jgi:hypothetical protein